MRHAKSLSGKLSSSGNVLLRQVKGLMIRNLSGREGKEERKGGGSTSTSPARHVDGCNATVGEGERGDEVDIERRLQRSEGGSSMVDLEIPVTKKGAKEDQVRRSLCVES